MIIDDNLIFSNLECENSNEVLRFLSDNLEKNGYVKWTLKEWKNNSNFGMSTPEKYMVKWIKPCH